MTMSANPKDIDAVIIFKADKLERIVPDVMEVDPGQDVQWIIVPAGHDAELSFPPENPLEPRSMKNTGDRIKGKVKPDVLPGSECKYSVVAGGITIDPSIRVKR